LCSGNPALNAQSANPQFKVIAFYTGKEDQAHISFVRERNQWFPRMGQQHGFSYFSTTNWYELNLEVLSGYQVVVFLDTRPENPASAGRLSEVHGTGWCLDGLSLCRFCPDALGRSAELELVP
jgi:hypothetical protein